MGKRWIAGLLVAASLSASEALAIDVAEGKLSVNGFGEWGYGRTSNANAYSIGAKDGSYDHGLFSLAVTARPSSEVVVAGQLFFQATGEASIDWAFVEYRLSDLARLRAGKVKNPFGLSMEVKDVGTLRPFFSLPQTIYGPGNIGSEAYLGAGVTGEWIASSGWGVGYDAYGGALQLTDWEPSEALATGPPYDFSSVTVEEKQARDVVGGRLALMTPVDGLTLRASAYSGKSAPDAGVESVRVNAVGFSAEYALDRVQVRGEIFRQNEGDVERNVAGYAEVAWRFLPRLQAALRFEQAKMTREGLDSASPLRDHVEYAFGLSYWPSPNAVFKASYHLIDGNRLALPAQSRDDGTFSRRTGLLVVGSQFSF